MRNLALGLFLFGAAMCAQPNWPLVESSWSEEFHLRRSDNGDTIAIGGLFASAETLYVYDMAGGRIVSFNKDGKSIARTDLASFGRGTYAGDDFVIRGDEALFLNTVDKRIEVFDLKSGAHKRSIPYPLDALDAEPRRIRRVITRIFLDQGRIVLGNAYHFFSFDEALGKKAKNTSVTSIEAGKRLQNLHEGHRVVVDRGRLYVGAAPKGDTIPTHFPVAGKRYTLFKGTLYTLVLGRKGMKIVAVR